MISGSRTIQKLPLPALQAMNRIMQKKFHVIVGDASGVDCLVQRYLSFHKYPNVTVYYALFLGHGKPRHTMDYPAIGILGNYQERDKQMCQMADYALAIWDGRSKGTKVNIERVPKTRVILA
ncbi:hypothetical protein PN462_21040 [Spirulina sp. CS-785/01]|uniref:hypothetical protein n=1 Tax=Spirulina sp. CS-785/01 TaxID=3021716 RepID=UPI00232C96DC|nr:hypothetical protein [Spirulina sp. CS-785/01]MDB9315612.1 hypothetical protein [Spirulina sp. CS-785/01]